MNDTEYMRFALELASKGLGQTNQNPLVGSVIVKNGEIAGFGAHLKFGEEHAEVHAIQMAGDKANGATIYITLEPCSHYGKTPPCADLIIKKGIKRVVVACRDPHEKVSGAGIKRLRQAGIEVDVGILEKESEDLNKKFFHYMKTKTPYITMKSAISLDGKTATVTGESKWITGELARLDVHQYRNTHDAILVGVNTVILDNPSLTTRLPSGGNHPIRIILDTTLRTPIDSNVVTDQEVETWIFIGKNVSAKKQELFPTNNLVKIIQLEHEKIAIDEVLTILGAKGITSVFVEGGSEINGSFLKNRQINQIITYIAPKLIGGKTASTAIGGTGFKWMSESVSLEIKDMKKIGTDIKIVAELLEEEEHVHRDY